MRILVLQLYPDFLEKRFPVDFSESYPTNISFSPTLCLGLTDSISDLLFQYFLLIARHYIYSRRIRKTLPTLQVYIQLIMNSMEIEKQIALDNNNIAFFKKKWASFKYCPLEE